MWTSPMRNAVPSMPAYSLLMKLLAFQQASTTKVKREPQAAPPGKLCLMTAVLAWASRPAAILCSCLRKALGGGPEIFSDSSLHLCGSNAPLPLPICLLHASVATHIDDQCVWQECFAAPAIRGLAQAHEGPYCIAGLVPLTGVHSVGGAVKVTKS